jgi:hypothetical protein
VRRVRPRDARVRLPLVGEEGGGGEPAPVLRDAEDGDRSPGRPHAAALQGGQTGLPRLRREGPPAGLLRTQQQVLAVQKGEAMGVPVAVRRQRRLRARRVHEEDRCPELGGCLPGLPRRRSRGGGRAGHEEHAARRCGRDKRWREKLSCFLKQARSCETTIIVLSCLTAINNILELYHC